MTNWEYIERAKLAEIVTEVAFTACLSRRQTTKLLKTAAQVDKFSYGRMSVDGVKCFWRQAFWWSLPNRNFWKPFDEAMYRKFRHSRGVVKIIY